SFEATALVEDVSDVAGHAARGRGLKFSTHMPGEPIFVRADVQRISQVLANLVSNAVKYTSTGEVSMTLRAPDEASGKLVFEIADTGPGLPQRGIDRLRTHLSRDEELQPRKDGSGVGLSVVRTVADHLGAHIDLDVKPGEGTRFIITVPVIFEDPDEVPSDATPDGLVLVVDDKPDIAASVTAIVKHYGHPCHIALSGPEAAAMLKRQSYETAFFDLDLPELGGVELARRVRASPGPNQQTYIVAITASRPEIPDGLFDEVLVKPVENLRVWWHLGHRSRALVRNRVVESAHSAE
ncbi:MAG: response regulator, partial [Alphaproteobacteria bacterium]|nr:response regulator [Alphaproteobacteria bacterium]